MAGDIAPTDALSQEEFSNLYTGALEISDSHTRIDALFVILATGRLGLKPRELDHVHEGWLDWTSGELRIPDHDPCACRQCWQRANAKRKRNDDRAVHEIVKEDCWSPPETGNRALSFGWSHRLTGVIGMFFEENTHLEYSHEEMETLVNEAASNAQDSNPRAVSLDELRASAVEFLARAGFRSESIADLAAIDESTARTFVEQTTTAEPPCELVCSSERLASEPFDPDEFGPNWRIQRGVDAADHEGNPRPVVTPGGSNIVPESLIDTSQSTEEPDPSVVAASIDDWVEAFEAVTEDETAESKPEHEVVDPETEIDEGDHTDSIATDESVAEVDPEEHITKPIEFAIDTRFASAAIESGRPTGGSVILGQDEILFLSRDDTGIAGFLTVNLGELVDLAPGYVPDQLSEFFDDTVGLAHLDENGDRKVVVCEVPSNIQWVFIQRIFSYCLRDVEAVVSDLPQIRGTVEAKEMQLAADEDSLMFESPDGEKRASIHMARIVDVEKGRMTHEDGIQNGLIVHQLSTNDTVRETEVRLKDEQRLKLLQRHLVLHLNKKKRNAKEVELADIHHELLEALYNTGEGRDLMTFMDVDPSNLTEAITQLKRHNLVRDGSSGVELTATGFLVASPEYSVVRN